MSDYNCALLLMAAGSSRRFGENKLLLTDSNCTYLAINTAQRYAHLSVKWAIINADQLSLLPGLCQLGYQVKVVSASSSFSESLKQLVHITSHYNAWLIALADMPLVSRSTVDQITLSLSQGNQLVVPRFQGVRGNPVGVGRQYLPVINALNGDIGLRKIVEQQPTQVTWIDTNDQGIIFDIDETKDWAQYNELVNLIR
ncbi:MAG: NTP transferase domain-containing protein [Betaproteobacteria bacterium]|nr:NTP transferase domain-containing protein [Betaproteobacteria bacterium]